ncbi:hypothetical protein EZV62_003149 [Acer yangbiense]|uniref:Uncharacterized protein n=1 Tax=Acer yangbiense TaxID=1000413 RepID=A0A5C7IGT4_9ROSI|nr:hypothetical protein EZV62_003149 [Acer yangbiense]
MDTKRLVIYHGGSWVGNSYEGGLTKWVHIPRGLTYDALVKLVQNVAKIDAARYTIELHSLVRTNSGVAQPLIENDNEVSCMMDEDKLIPEQLAACGSIPISDPIVCTDETIHHQENSQELDTDNSDDGMGASSASAGPSGFASFGEGSFGKDGLGEDGSGEHPTPRAWIILESESSEATAKVATATKQVRDDGTSPPFVRHDGEQARQRRGGKNVTAPLNMKQLIALEELDQEIVKFSDHLSLEEAKKEFGSYLAPAFD